MYNVAIYVQWLRMGRQLLASNRRFLARLLRLLVGALIAPEYRMETHPESEPVLVAVENGYPPQKRPQKFF